ncbi:MAG: Na/Pi cotransporter family protein [Myxococcales bacterium]|nr:Na/Pi cotransporter family protein [Myxococcales bacterium]
MNSILTIIGGLGVFLFGLRVMSDGLQKMAGNRLRSILAKLTVNRFAGVVSGFLVTCAVQSSSATTVLVVSFANAGLLSLTQAMGLVMGANIGTTLTAWIIALIGFEMEISSFALPIIGIGFPLSFLGSPRSRQISEVMVGFGLLFLGLKFLKDGLPDLKEDPALYDLLNSLTGFGFGSILLFIIAGVLITVIVQSSSASTAIILTMVAKQWIGLDLAAAMALGANVGTTITAQLAVIGANRNAKRVAHFHTLFNILGVLMILPFIAPLLEIMTLIVPGDADDPIILVSRVAAFHTTFNIIVTVILAALVSQLEKVVLWLVPLVEGETERAHLHFLSTGLQGTPELATVEARRALQNMVRVCTDMFGNLKEVIGNPEKKLGNLVDDIKREEQKTDEMEEEIIDFCSQLARSGTSLSVGRSVSTFLEIANDVERIGDHCMNLVLLAERRWEKKYTFSEQTQEELDEMMVLVGDFLQATERCLGPDGEESLAEVKLLEDKINNLRNKSRKSHARRMQDGDVNVREGLIFLDMMTNMEKVGDYCFNVCTALSEAA